MLIKTKFTGASMIKYSIGSMIIKLVLIALCIMSSISNGTAIIDHIQAVVNNGIDLDLYYALKQLGIIVLKFIGAIVIEVVIVFLIIFPMAKSEMKRNW